MARNNRLTPGSRTPFLDFANDVHNFGARKVGRTVRGTGRALGGAVGGAVGAVGSIGNVARSAKQAVRNTVQAAEDRIWGGRSVSLDGSGRDRSGQRQRVDMSRSGFSGLQNRKTSS